MPYRPLVVEKSSTAELTRKRMRVPGRRRPDDDVGAYGGDGRIVHSRTRVLFRRCQMNPRLYLGVSSRQCIHAIYVLLACVYGPDHLWSAVMYS